MIIDLTTIIVTVIVFTLATSGYVRIVRAVFPGLMLSLLGIAFYVYFLYFMVNYR
jgi:hypothetical protein